MKNGILLVLVILTAMTLSGCLGGGGGGGSSAGGGGFASSSSPSNSGGEAIVAGEQIVVIDEGGGNIGATTPNPEPATMVLFGTGLLGMALFRKRKNIKKGEGMKKIILLLAICSLVLGITNAYAVIEVGSYGETGWQTFTNTFESAWTGKVGVAVSNFGDTALSPVLLVDNLNFGPAGNMGFELGNFTGYTPDGDVALVTSFDSFFGTTYTPTEGTYMARLLASGADTSAYGGTNGAYLWLTDDVSFAAGDTTSFDWNFLAFDYYPFEDFAFLLHEEEGEGGYGTETLGKIGPIPEPATLSLLGIGLLGLAGLRKKKT